MKIFYLVLGINAFILADARTAPGYAKQYTAAKNPKTVGNKRYLFLPVLSSSNVFQGRQFPFRRTIPLVAQSDSVGGQQPANNPVSLLSLIALALNLGNSLFAVPAAPVQRDPASSVAAGVTTGILNYISAQGGQTQPQSNFNDPVLPNRLGINPSQNDMVSAMVADSAGVSKLRQYKLNTFPFQRGDWAWTTEYIKEKKKSKRFPRPPQRMTNLNIFLNKGPQSQQVFNRMKHSQSMGPRQLKTFEKPNRIIVLVPDHHVHHMHHMRPSHRPIYHPPHHRPSYRPIYQPSHQPHYKPHKPHKQSYHHQQTSYSPYDDDDFDDDDDDDDDYDDEDDYGEYTVPVIIEDDDEDDYDRPTLYRLSTELVDAPLDYIAPPAPYDDKPSEISMDEDDEDVDDNNNEAEEDEEEEATDEVDEKFDRPDESSKERIKGEELKQINNRLKVKKA